MEAKTLYAKLNTASNFMGLNGQFVEIKYFLGTIVHCQVFSQSEKRTVTFDVTLKEVTEIRERI